MVEDNIIFKPNPGPQTEFLKASEQEVLFGGAAGGGKSYGLLADAIRDLGHPAFNGLIVRKTRDELRELIDKSKELYPKVFPNGRVKWREQDSTWTHQNGGKLWMSYLDADRDATRYQGMAFTYIAFDELTHWETPYAWEYLRSRLRAADPYFKDKIYMRATTNPGGVGHTWVKKMFIDPAPWGEAFDARDSETDEVLTFPPYDGYGNPHPRAGEPLFKRRFIPSRLSDNPYFDDGAYEANLLSLTEHERERLLYGNWDIISGAAFPEFDRKIHVVDDVFIPNNWKKFRACDYGYKSHAAVLWFALAPNNQIIVFRELYVKGMDATELAHTVNQIDKEVGGVRYGMLDSSCWNQKGEPGLSIAEAMIKAGCRWSKSDRSKGSRIAGKNEIHRLLKVNEFTGEPGLVISEDCINTIAQLPVLPLDEKNTEDVDTNYVHDHIYDALRYGVASRPEFNKRRMMNANRHRPADPTFGY